MSSFSINSDSPMWIWERAREGIYKCVINEFASGLLYLGQTQTT